MVWGTTWMAIEYQLGTVAPEVSIFYRYLIASGLLFAWCLARGRRLRFTLADHRRFLQLGLALFSLNYVLTYYAQQHITSAVTAIAFSTMLWMNILNSRLFFGTRVDGKVVAGSTLGIAGIVILFLPEVGTSLAANGTMTGILLAIAGAYVASLGNMVSQAAQSAGLPVVQSNAWGMFYGALLTGMTALGEGHGFAVDGSSGYLLSLLYLAVFGSIVGFGSYLTLLGRVGAGRAGYAMVMFPVVAIGTSVVMGESQPGIEMIVGVALVMAGNLLVLGRRRRITRRAEQQA
jgi:drug/metabolite transporter (DMT)-like permease